MTDKTDSKERDALMKEFCFFVEEQSGVWTLIEDSGCTRPANIYERVLWQEMLAGRASLAASAGSEPVALPFAILADEMAALRRFDECIRDDGIYDISKEMMKRLAEIGLVRRVTGNIYEHTTFGLSVLSGDFSTHPSPPEGMVATDAMIDAGKKMLHNSNGRGAREKVERIFNAMIAAAPPTSSADSRKGDRQ